MDARRHWVVQVSKSTGKQYWFNTKTGISTYAEPEELRQGQPLPADLAKLAGAPSAPGHAVPTPDDPAPAPVVAPDGFTAAQREGLESSDFLAYRDAAESICRGLAAAAAAAKDPPPDGPPRDAWRLALQRRFPAHDSAHRAATHEMAEEFGLESFSGLDSDGGKYVIVFAPAAPPDEVLQERADEEALAAEAEARRRAEAELVAAAAAAARGRAPPAAAKRRRAGEAPDPAAVEAAGVGGGGTGAARGAAAIDDLLPEAPLRAPKRDRRTIEQIQQELDEKRRRELPPGDVAALDKGDG